LAPGMRLGWLVPPGRLREDLVEAKHAADLGSPALPQLVLAHLIATGELEHHIRQVRKRQRSRRDALLGALGEYLPGARVQGVAAGLHLLITFPELPGQVEDTDLAESIHRAGVLVHPLSWHRQLPGVPGLVLGYAAHPPDQLREAAQRIARILAAGAPGAQVTGAGAPGARVTGAGAPGAGSRDSGSGIGWSARRGSPPRVGAAMPPGRGPQLSHARHAGQDRQQRTADGREQQRHAEREMPVRAEVRDVHRPAVLQDEDQQQQQNHGKERDRYP